MLARTNSADPSNNVDSHPTQHLLQHPAVALRLGVAGFDGNADEDGRQFDGRNSQYQDRWAGWPVAAFSRRRRGRDRDSDATPGAEAGDLFRRLIAVDIAITSAIRIGTATNLRRKLRRFCGQIDAGQRIADFLQHFRRAGWSVVAATAAHQATHRRRRNVREALKRIRLDGFSRRQRKNRASSAAASATDFQFAVGPSTICDIKSHQSSATGTRKRNLRVNITRGQRSQETNSMSFSSILLF